jgi:small subunit ribosomal protein S16
MEGMMTQRDEDTAALVEPELEIRLQRIATRKVPMFRVVVVEASSRADGRFLEQVGLYDPTLQTDPARFTLDRLRFWVDAGAVPVGEASGLVQQALTPS